MRSRAQRPTELEQCIGLLQERVASEKAEISGYLIVAAAGCVQATCRLADQLVQAPLNPSVDILPHGFEVELPLLQLAGDNSEAVDYGAGVCLTDNPSLREHATVCRAPEQIVWPEAPVKGD